MEGKEIFSQWECTVSGFAGDILDYNELLPAGTTVVPVVSATVTEPHAVALIMQDQKISIRSAGDIRFLQVSDIQGKLMFNRKVDSSETSVDTETWKSGVYIFKISTLNGVITKKISVIQ